MLGDVDEELESYEEAIGSRNKEKREGAMKEEMRAIEENNNWSL